MSSSPARPAGLVLAASVLALCPVLGATMPAREFAPAALAQQDAPARPPGEVVKEINKLGKDAPVALYAEIANQRTEEAFEALTGALDRMEKDYRFQAAAYLMMDRFLNQPGLETEAIIWLYERAEKSDGTASSAAMALARFGARAELQLLDLLRNSDDAGVRSQMLRPLLPSLSESGSAEAFELILRNWTSVRVCTEKELEQYFAKFHGSVVLPILRKHVRDERLGREPRRAAIASITDMPGEEATKLLRNCLERRCPEWLQLAALRALRERGCMTHAKDVKRLMHSSDPVVRYTAFLEEGRLNQGDPDYHKTVLKRAKSRSAVERQAAAATLGYIPRSKALEPLLKLLDDRDHAVRMQALMTIETLRWYPTLEPLIQRMGRTDPVMNVKIHATLARLTGLPMPPSPDIWQAWWKGDGALFKLPSAEDAAAALIAFEETRAIDGAGDTVSSFFGVPVISSRVVFILDVSGSMAAEYKTTSKEYATGGSQVGTRLDAAKKQLLGAIAGIDEGHQFNVMFFETEIHLWSDGMAKAGEKSRKSASAFVAKQEPMGGTNLYDALEAVFTDYEMDVDTIYVLSDGQPNGSPQRIREAVREWNSLRHVTVHTISLGGVVPLMQQLADDTGGEFRQVK